MNFLEIFNPIEKGNYALTDEAIYMSILNHDQMIPLWGGNKEHTTIDRMVSKSAKTKKGVPIKVFSGEGIIISLDGSAGNMTYKTNEEFALNHHAGFITVREDIKTDINLKFFSLFYQNRYKHLSVSDGSKTLSLKQIYNEEIHLPTIDIQNNIMKKLNTCLNAINKFHSLENQLYELVSREIICP